MKFILIALLSLSATASAGSSEEEFSLWCESAELDASGARHYMGVFGVTLTWFSRAHKTDAYPVSSGIVVMNNVFDSEVGTVSKAKTGIGLDKEMNPLKMTMVEKGESVTLLVESTTVGQKVIDFSKCQKDVTVEVGE